MITTTHCRTIVVATLMASLTAGCSGPGDAGAAPVFEHGVRTTATPWTHDRFDASADRFTFAVFSDLQGGERDGVFDVAMTQVNLLRPELILSVGDLIDGNSEDPVNLNGQWMAFDEKTSKAIAPVFYTGGNHDLTNVIMREVWAERYGERYYHFVYKNVLFLVLDTEDNDEARMQEIFVARAAAIEAFEAGGEAAFEETEYFRMPERSFGMIGERQLAYVRAALDENEGARWTFLLMHKPAWKSAADTGFDRIEAALGERPYTVLNGHLHSYAHATRNGRDYITLGTTGGSQPGTDPMSFDHLMIVTMTDDGPSIANLRLEGILDATGQVPDGGGNLCFQASACGGD